MLALADNLLFSTELIAEPHPPLDQWSYYGLEHGQHVAFYSARTLRYLAERYKLHLRSWPAGNLHLLTREKIPDWSWSLFHRSKVRRIAARLRHSRPSLLLEDYRMVVAKIKDGVA